MRVGVLLTALAAVGIVFTGSYRSTSAAEALVVIAALYLVGGGLAGAIVGLLLPMARKPLGLFVVGTLAGVPFFAAVLSLVYGLSWNAEATVVLLIVSPSFALATTFAWFVLGGRRIE